MIAATSPLPVAGAGELGFLLALLLTFAILALGLWADRRLDRWLGTPSEGRSRLWRRLQPRLLVLRLGIWVVAAALALAGLTALAPGLAWIAFAALGISAALAFSHPLRDVALGAAYGLGRRSLVGEHVEIGSLVGQVVHVGLRGLALLALDGTRVEIPHSRVARDGLRRLRAEPGGTPVSLVLPVPGDLAVEPLLEEARLAACLALHAHLAARPTIELRETTPPHIAVTGMALDPPSAAAYRSEVALAYRDALSALRRASED